MFLHRHSRGTHSPYSVPHATASFHPFARRQSLLGLRMSLLPLRLQLLRPKPQTMEVHCLFCRPCHQSSCLHQCLSSRCLSPFHRVLSSSFGTPPLCALLCGNSCTFQ